MESGKRMVERPMRIQSLSTPATLTVMAPVRPMTRKTEKLRARAHRAFVKNTQKSNLKLGATIIAGFSNIAQGTDRKRKLQDIKIAT